MPRWGIVIALALALAGGGVTQAASAAYSLRAAVIAQGGNVSGGGPYQLGVTAAEPLAGEQRGGRYQLLGGFWAAAARGPLPQPRAGTVFLPMVGRNAPP